jgi:hypothetical protein
MGLYILECWKVGHIVKLPTFEERCFYQHQRMKTSVNKKLCSMQAGFREGKSCTDHTAVLRIIIEQLLELNSSVYVTFIEFEKAFDSPD